MRGMSFCLCHLSITCYIMGDLHSAATGLTKASRCSTKEEKETDATFLRFTTVLEACFKQADVFCEAVNKQAYCDSVQANYVETPRK